MAPEAFDFETFQRWMLTAISHPDGLSGGLRAAHHIVPVSEDTLADVVEPSEHLTARERLGIYADMYFWRLVDILAEDFEAVRHAVGPDAFYDLAVAYLVAHPSRSKLLNGLGCHLGRFLAETPLEVPHRAFVAELARFESSLEDVFDAPHAEPLSAAQVQAIAPERWGGARLTLVPALRLHSFSWRVNSYFQAVMDDEHPKIPEPQPSWVVVYRSQFKVWRMHLTVQQHTLLSSLESGLTLGEALTACASLPGTDVEALVDALGGWFQEWAAEGFFCGVTLQDPE